MLTTHPLNDVYMGPVGGDWSGSVTLAGFNTGQRAVAVMLDTMLMDGLSASASNILLFGSDGDTNWWFDVTMPAAGVSSNVTVRFSTTRNAVTKSSSGTVAVGQRTVLVGVDDGESVTLTINGTAQTAATWTAAQASYPIVNAAVYLWNDPTAVDTSPARLYEAMVRANGDLVAHYRPELTQSGVTLKDKSEFANDLTIVSASTYNVRSIWDREVSVAWP